MRDIWDLPPKSLVVPDQNWDPIGLVYTNGECPPGAGVEIFSDGSKMCDIVGCAYAIYEMGNIMHFDVFRLSDTLSIYEAEL